MVIVLNVPGRDDVVCRESVLAHIRAGDAGSHDRQPSHHHRHILHREASSRAGMLPARQGRPHLQQHRRPSLHPGKYFYNLRAWLEVSVSRGHGWKYLYLEGMVACLPKYYTYEFTSRRKSTGSLWRSASSSLLAFETPTKSAMLTVPPLRPSPLNPRHPHPYKATSEER